MCRRQEQLVSSNLSLSNSNAMELLVMEIVVVQVIMNRNVFVRFTYMFVLVSVLGFTNPIAIALLFIIHHQ
uniref:G_PROTEIN_RECEP_F1_2 domain-containing protein n=1 Tax=Ascaris lumbricoides TaxID=6252 RepID=A0A0M3IH97_ASCLU